MRGIIPGATYHIWCDVPSLFLECAEESLDCKQKNVSPQSWVFALMLHGSTFMMRICRAMSFSLLIHGSDFAIAYKTKKLSLDFYLYHYKRYNIPHIFYVYLFVERLSLTLHYTMLILHIHSVLAIPYDLVLGCLL